MHHSRTSRNRWLIAPAIAMAGTLSAPAQGENLRGDLVFLHWTRGGEHRMFRELEAMFAKQNPGIKIR